MYKIIDNHERRAVIKDGKIDCHGFMRDEDALHAIWVSNGANPEHFYRCKDGTNVTLDITPFNNR